MYSGLFIGLIMFCVGAVLASFTLNLISLSRELTGIKSFEKLAYHLYGRWAYYLAILCLALNLYGTTISYIVASGHTLSFVINSFVRDAVSPQVATIFVLVFIIFPLSLLKSMASLRYSSLVGVLCVCFLSVTVLFKYFQFCADHISVMAANESHTVTCFWEPQEEEIILVNMVKPKDILKAVPLVLYAYTCHPSLLPVLMELQRPTIKRMRSVANYANMFSCLVYCSIGSFVYLTFQSQLGKSNGNFLQNDYKKDSAILLGALALSISLTFAVPLFVTAFRKIVIPILSYYLDIETYNKIVVQKSRVKNGLRQRLLSDEQDDNDEDNKDPFSEVNMIWHSTIAIVFLLLAGLPAILVEDISIVFTILGGTTNPLLCFVFPAMFIAKAGGSEHRYMKVFSFLISLGLPLLCLSSLLMQWLE